MACNLKMSSVFRLSSGGREERGAGSLEQVGRARDWQWRERPEHGGWSVD